MNNNILSAIIIMMTHMINFFLTDLVPTLTEDERILFESYININEFTKCLRKMKLNKTPGTDGLTVLSILLGRYKKNIVLESLVYALQM